MSKAVISIENEDHPKSNLCEIVALAESSSLTDILLYVFTTRTKLLNTSSYIMSVITTA